MQDAMLMCQMVLPVDVCNIELFVTKSIWFCSHFYFAAHSFTLRCFIFISSLFLLHNCLCTCALNKTLVLCPSDWFHRVYNVCI